VFKKIEGHCNYMSDNNGTAEKRFKLNGYSWHTLLRFRLSFSSVQYVLVAVQTVYGCMPRLTVLIILIFMEPLSEKKKLFSLHGPMLHYPIVGLLVVASLTVSSYRLVPSISKIKHKKEPKKSASFFCKAGNVYSDYWPTSARRTLRTGTEQAV